MTLIGPGLLLFLLIVLVASSLRVLREYQRGVVFQLGRFWKHRGQDGMRREKQLLIDYLCACAGGPMLYVGRDMKVAHKGMKIDESDWRAFMTHVEATLDSFKVPAAERAEVVAFVSSLKADILD